MIALFNLKPGVDRAAYEAWARATDLPTVAALPSIDRFEVFRATGVLGSDAALPYAFLEFPDVNGMHAFGADCASAAMTKIAAAFREMVDVTFLTTEPLA